MSQENVEIVRRLYEAMNARDLDLIRELGSPDVEWVPDPIRVADKPVRGLEGVIRFFTDRAEVFSELRTEPEGFRETDDKVVVFLHVTGKGEASGAEFDIRAAHLWTLKDGVVVRREGFGDRAEALEAAGREE